VRPHTRSLAGVSQVEENICTPRNGAPLIAPTQDFLTGGYLLTRRDCFLDKGQFCQAIAAAFDGAPIQIDLPPPAIVKVRSNYSCQWGGG